MRLLAECGSWKLYSSGRNILIRYPNVVTFELTEFSNHITKQTAMINFADIVKKLNIKNTENDVKDLIRSYMTDTQIKLSDAYNKGLMLETVSKFVKE